MATPYTFRLVTQEGTVVDSDRVTSVTVPGSEGWLGVLARHAPMVSVIREGCVCVEEEEAGKAYYVVDEGVLQVKRNETVILVDYAEKVSGPDEAREKLAAQKPE